MELAIENGQTLMDVVLQFFQEDQWNFQKVEQKPVVRAGYRGEHGTWVCYAQLDEEDPRFLFDSYCGLNISPQDRPAVAEYITRVNYLLHLGNFEMKWDTGDVWFRTSCAIVDSNLSFEMIGTLVYTNVQTMDHYFPGIVSVVHGGLSPQAALDRIDGIPVAVLRESERLPASH